MPVLKWEMRMESPFFGRRREQPAPAKLHHPLAKGKKKHGNKRQREG
jgi:hypothetical protein